MTFGITRDIIGSSLVEVEIPEGSSATDLKTKLETTYPAIKKLKSLLIAINEEYGDDDYILQEKDDIALIPPVSGG